MDGTDECAYSIMAGDGDGVTDTIITTHRSSHSIHRKRHISAKILLILISNSKGGRSGLTTGFGRTYKRPRIVPGERGIDYWSGGWRGRDWRWRWRSNCWGWSRVRGSSCG